MNLSDYISHTLLSEASEEKSTTVTNPETLTPLQLYEAVERNISEVNIYNSLYENANFDFAHLMNVALKQATITEHDRNTHLQTALSFSGDGERLISSWSSSCVIKGPTKIGKTTVAAILTAALLGQAASPFRGYLPDDAEILWVDTEQSRTHCYKVGALIGKLVLGKSTLHPRVKMLMIRQYSAKVKWEFIQYAVTSNKAIKVVVIDNLADLVTSILDEEQASVLMGALLKLAETRSLLLVNVIHTNKGNKHSRGHLGSLAEQRAETVISVEKSGKRIKIEGSLTRNGPFPPVWYERQNDDIQFFFQHEPRTDSVFKKNFSNTTMEVHKDVVSSIFKNQGELFPYEFKALLKNEYERRVHPIGLELVKKLQAYYVTEGIIQKEGSKLRMAH